MKEKIVEINFTGGDQPPYEFKIEAIRDEGTKVVLLEQTGSWVDAFFRMQELRREIGIPKTGECPAIQLGRKVS